MSSRPGRPSPAAPRSRPAAPRDARPTVWVARGGRKAGPITADNLKRRILSRELNGRDHVWWEGAHAWTAIADIPELARLLPLSEPTPDPAADPFAATGDPFANVVDRAQEHAPTRESTRVFMMEAGLGRAQRWRRHLALGIAMVGGLAGVIALAVVLAEQPERIELPEVVVADVPTPGEVNDQDNVAASPGGTIVTSTWRCLQGGNCTADDEPTVLVRKPTKKARRARRPSRATPPKRGPAVASSRTAIDDDGLAEITAIGGFSSRDIDVGEKDHVRLRLRIEAPAVDGGERDAEAVFAIVKTRMEGLSQCASGARAAALPAGRHEIVFTVDEAGATSRVRLGRALRASAAGNCVSRQVRKWRFPAASGEASVSFPLILTR